MEIKQTLRGLILLCAFGFPLQYAWASVWLEGCQREDVFSSDWKGGINAGIYQEKQGRDDILISRDPAGSSKNAIRIHIAQDTDYSRVANGAPRAELSLSRMFKVRNDVAYRFKVDIYIPPDFIPDESQPESILQIHQGESKGPPPFALIIRGSDYFLEVRGGSSGSRGESIRLGSVSADRGKWVAWILGYRSERSGMAGTISVEKNGIENVFREKIANAYPDDDGAYFKFGLYKWDWQRRKSDVKVRVIYYGSIEIDGCKMDNR